MVKIGDFTYYSAEEGSVSDRSLRVEMVYPDSIIDINIVSISTWKVDVRSRFSICKGSPTVGCDKSGPNFKTLQFSRLEWTAGRKEITETVNVVSTIVDDPRRIFNDIFVQLNIIS